MDERKIPGEDLAKRMDARTRRRPRLGLTPEFYTRLGLADPWAVADAPVQEEAGDGMVFLSAAPFYAMMRRLAASRRRRERRQAAFAARRAGHSLRSASRRWPGESLVPRSRLASLAVEDMTLPPPVVQPAAVIEEGAAPDAARTPYERMRSVASPWLITPFTPARTAMPQARAADAAGDRIARAVHARHLDEATADLPLRARRAVARAGIETVVESDRAAAIVRIVRRSAAAPLVRTVYEDAPPALRAAVATSIRPISRSPGMALAASADLDRAVAGSLAAPERVEAERPERARRLPATQRARARAVRTPAAPLLAASPVAATVAAVARPQRAALAPRRSEPAPRGESPEAPRRTSHAARLFARAELIEAAPAPLVRSALHRTAAGEWIAARQVRTGGGRYLPATVAEAPAPTVAPAAWAAARTASGETRRGSVLPRSIAVASEMSLPTPAVTPVEVVAPTTTARTTGGTYVPAREAVIHAAVPSALPRSAARLVRTGATRDARAPSSTTPVGAWTGAAVTRTPDAAWRSAPTAEPEFGDFFRAPTSRTPDRDFRGAGSARTPETEFAGAGSFRTEGAPFEGAASFSTPSTRAAARAPVTEIVEPVAHTPAAAFAAARATLPTATRSALPRTTPLSPDLVLPAPPPEVSPAPAAEKIAARAAPTTPYVAARVYRSASVAAVARSNTLAATTLAARAATPSPASSPAPTGPLGWVRAASRATPRFTALHGAAETFVTPEGAASASTPVRTPQGAWVGARTGEGIAAASSTAVRVASRATRPRRSASVAPDRRLLPSEAFTGAAVFTTENAAYAGAPLTRTRATDWVGARLGTTEATAYRGALAARTPDRTFAGAATAWTPAGTFVGGTFVGAPGVRTAEGAFTGAPGFVTGNAAWAGAPTAAGALTRARAANRRLAPGMELPASEALIAGGNPSRPALHHTLAQVATGESTAPATPTWAARSAGEPMVRSAQGLFGALAKAASPAEVVRVIFERAEGLRQTGPLPAPILEVAEQLRLEVRREEEASAPELLAVRDSTLPSPSATVLRGTSVQAVASSPSRAMTSVRPVRSSARTVGGGGGDQRIMKLVKKLESLIHLAEVENRLSEAQRRVRMAEDTAAARAEGQAPIGKGGKDSSKLDLEALSREVLESVTRELEMRRERRTEDGDESIWW